MGNSVRGEREKPFGDEESVAETVGSNDGEGLAKGRDFEDVGEQELDEALGVCRYFCKSCLNKT